MPVQRLIQLSDCHLGADDTETLLGINVDESFRDVLTLLNTQDDFDGLVATGDISSKGVEGAYHRFIDYMSAYQAKSIAWLPGNHDRASDMAAIQGHGISNDVMTMGAWRFIMLDSSIPGSEFGRLADTELLRLRDLLASSNHNTIVFVHHQPVPVGSEWLDQYTISNGDGLLAILDEYPQVKALCWGHVHQVYEAQRGHYKLLSSPSTCIQFKPQSDDFVLDTAMPGFRWFELHDDGHFDSGVLRVEHKDYGIDFSSSGY